MKNGDGALRVALCHEWLTTLGGSDICAARIASLLDVDKVFVFTRRDALAKELFDGRDLETANRLGDWGVVREHWTWFLPAMPWAWKRVDLHGFDVVITSSHACTNAVRVPSGTAHISYCYTPMRYAWDWRRESRRLPVPLQVVWAAVARAFRSADRRWAQKVDAYIAISRTVADRIRQFYGRDALVVYPPVDTRFWTPAPAERRDFFLAAGRLVGYKRFDIAVEAFSASGMPLVVAGSGPELRRLQQRAGPNVRFEVQPTRERLRDLYRTARALVFPGVEDFGLVPVEAQACGTPVVALGQGGATETVRDGVTGVLYEGDAPEALLEGVKRVEAMDLDPAVIRTNSERFDVAVFDREFQGAIRSALSR